MNEFPEGTLSLPHLAAVRKRPQYGRKVPAMFEYLLGNCSFCTLPKVSDWPGVSTQKDISGQNIKKAEVLWWKLATVTVPLPFAVQHLYISHPVVLFLYENVRM